MRALRVGILLFLLLVTTAGQWGESNSSKWGRIETASSGDFSPADISGLKIDFDPAYGVGFSAGSNIDDWACRQGSGTVVQANPGKQPLWVAEVALANNQPGVQFDGTSDQMEGDVADVAQPFTLILLATEPTDNNALRHLFARADSNEDFLEQRGASNDYNINLGSAQSAGAIVAGNPLARWRLQADYVSSIFYKNGVQTAAASAGNHGIQSFAFGAAHIGTVYYANTTFIRLLVYDHILTAGELVKLNAWLTTKYGAGV